MIYGNSTHPVLIKKINLKIWTLRDEIEAIIRERVGSQGSDKVDLTDLIEEYKRKELVTERPLKLVDGEQVSENEDAMLEAMQSEDGEEPEAVAELSEEKKEEITENVKILRRVPSVAEDKIHHGKVVLSEVDMEHMSFFCSQKFYEGQSIVIDFHIPMRFVMNADVIYCRPYNMKSRIISANKLPYRVAVKFTFLKEGERTLLRNFISTIEPELDDLMPVAKPKAQAEEESDFDELDDLDL